MEKLKKFKSIEIFIEKGRKIELLRIIVLIYWNSGCEIIILQKKKKNMLFTMEKMAETFFNQ